MHFEPKKSKIGQFLTELDGIVDKINQPNYWSKQCSPDFQTNFDDGFKSTEARWKPGVWL